MAMCVMAVVAVVPCQCFSPAGMHACGVREWLCRFFAVRLLCSSFDLHVLEFLHLIAIEFADLVGQVRSASASLTPGATKAAANVRRIHVNTRGREDTCLRIEAANNPYPMKTANVRSMNTVLSSNMRASGCGSLALTNCGRNA